MQEDIRYIKKHIKKVNAELLQSKAETIKRNRIYVKHMETFKVQ